MNLWELVDRHPYLATVWVFCIAWAIAYHSFSWASRGTPEDDRDDTTPRD